MYLSKEQSEGKAFLIASILELTKDFDVEKVVFIENRPSLFERTYKVYYNGNVEQYKNSLRLLPNVVYMDIESINFVLAEKTITITYKE